MVKPLLLVVSSIILFLCGHLAVVTRWEPGVYSFYVTGWWSYIILLDALSTWRLRNQATDAKAVACPGGTDERAGSEATGEMNFRKILAYLKAARAY